MKTGLSFKNSSWQINEHVEAQDDQMTLARQYNMPAGYQGKRHSHDWFQLMYASSGLLNVEFQGQFMVMPPQKAIWLPPQYEHSVRAPTGARFRSLYFNPDRVKSIGQDAKIFNVSSLIKELILAVVERCDIDISWQDHDERLLTVLLDQLANQPVNSLSLLIPKDTRVSKLVEVLQSDPCNALSLTEWANTLGVSSRTLTRIFIAETGVGFKEWRQKIRLLHSLSLLEQGLSVTQVAYEVGYHSSSAFSYAFQQLFSVSPKHYFL
ncbi:AraC family transcriptional regulator [Marinomonas sp.]